MRLFGKGRRARKQEEQQEQELRQVLGFLQTLIIIGALGLGVTVAVGLRGIFAVEGGFTGWLVPIAFAVVLTTLLAGLWHITLEWVSRMDADDNKQVWTALAFAGLLMAVHGATSVPFLASAIGGGDAVRHHDERHLSALSVAADNIGTAVNGQARLQSGLARQRANLEDLLAAEIAGDGVSGISGFGPVARDIQDALNAVSRSGRASGGQSRAFRTRLQAARTELDAARRASLSGDRIAFAEKVVTARSLLSELSTTQGLGVPVEYDFAGSDLAALQGIGTDLRFLLAQDDAVTPRVSLPTFEPMSKPVAALTYPEQIPLAWSVAIAAEILPLAIVLLLILYRRMQQTAENTAF